MGQARQTGESVAVVNGCSPTRDFGLLFSALAEARIAATNVTVAANEDFVPAMVWVNRFLDAVERSEGRVALATDVATIRSAHRDGRAAVVLGFQNAQPIGDSVDHLELFYRLGLRIMQLTYQRRNLIGDGCGEDSDGGLSRFGRDVVRRCNELGVLIDLSHVGDRTCLETVEASRQPVAITHANLRSVNPVARNKPDDVVRAVAESGGIFGVGVVSRLMTPLGRTQGTQLSDLIDHIRRVADLVGPQHVGIGTDVVEGMTREDFAARQRGFLARFPELRAGGDFRFEDYYTVGMASSAGLNAIPEALEAAGFSGTEIAGIMGENFLRVFEAVWS